MHKSNPEKESLDETKHECLSNFILIEWHRILIFWASVDHCILSRKNRQSTYQIAKYNKFLKPYCINRLFFLVETKTSSKKKERTFKLLRIDKFSLVSRQRQKCYTLTHVGMQNYRNILGNSQWPAFDKVKHYLHVTFVTKFVTKRAILELHNARASRHFGHMTSTFITYYISLINLKPVKIEQTRHNLLRRHRSRLCRNWFTHIE